MKTGKLPPDILTCLLSRTRSDSTVIIGPAYGEDAAAVRFGGRVLVAAADPITFTTDRIGRYAVSVNANDIAVLGATPRYFLATILLPPEEKSGLCQSDSDVDCPPFSGDIESIFNDIEQTCRAIDVTLIGGHTEITTAVTRPVVSGCMIGEADESNLIRTSGARVGDMLILVGGYAIEGAAILAREAADDLRGRGLTDEPILRARAYLDSPGICILRYAQIAMQTGGVTAMHDPTEGGVATAIHEMAAAGDCGFSIDREALEDLCRLPCKAMCQVLGLDPLGLLASGSLLLTAASDRADAICKAYKNSNISASVIGTVTEERNVRFTSGAPFPSFARDEIARYFDEKE